MDLFMPAERVLYDRAYCLSDEAEKDYAFEVAEEHGVDVGEVLYSDELMKEVRDALDRDIDLYLDDEIANFDSMLRELKCGDDPEHPAEISVVAMGSVGRWDVPSRGLVAANSLRDLIDGKGSGQLAFIESTPAELQDDYPTPVHVFSYDGRDSEPVHRTDVHLDGDAMTLDPVKGTPAHNGAQAHGGDRLPADLAKAASAAANRTAGSHADEAGGIKH